MLMFESQTEAPARSVWQVAALSRAMADALTARFGIVSVQGELSGFNRATSGHCYFALKDGQEPSSAQLRCAMFRTSAQRLAFEPRDGDAVELRARIDIYAPRGDMQLIVESMRRAGAGTLFEQFERLKAKLAAQGLFDAARKRPIPERPRAIGLVTSLGAAALHDVLSALKRRAPHIPVLLAPASVQGTNAPQALCTALQNLYQQTEEIRGLEGEKASNTPPIDVILLVRGGGSLEDLWAFNDEQLAHTMVQSPVPIVSGVGHETDFTIADFCADLRAPTPTAAAELCATPRQQLLQDLQGFEQSLSNHLARRLQTDAQRLDRMAWRIGRPAQSLGNERERLALLAQRLQRAPQAAVQRFSERFRPIAGVLTAQAATIFVANKHRLDNLSTRLQAASHERTLARGYAMLTGEDGAVLTRAAQLQAGQGVQIHLQDGSAGATVNEVGGT
jgi:exodeoxyribonuclease VII large subunit